MTLQDREQETLGHQSEQLPDDQAPALLRPPDLTVVVVPRGGAPEEYVALARRYWNWAGFDPASYSPRRHAVSRWTESTSSIAPPDEHISRPFVLAAAGVDALLLSYECSTCKEPVALRSRASLDAVASGEEPARHCARCHEQLQIEVVRALDPKHRERRRAKHERAVAQQAAAAEAVASRERRQTLVGRWHQACREVIRATYPLTLCHEQEEMDWSRYLCRLRPEIGLLALLDHAPGADPIPPVEAWDIELAPSIGLTDEIMIAALRTELLDVHPEKTPIDAFVWQQSLTDAVDSADGESGQLPPAFLAKDAELYPTKVAWYAWQGASLGVAAENLREHLSRRAHSWLATGQGQAELIGIVTDLISAEGVRYFHH